MTVEEFYKVLSSLEDTKCDIEQTNEFKRNLMNFFLTLGLNALVINRNSTQCTTL